MVTLEQILDKLADELIVKSFVTPSVVRQNQKTIVDGFIKFGRENVDDRLLLYESDVDANQEDLINTIQPGDIPMTLEDIVNDINTVSQGGAIIDEVTYDIQESNDGMSLAVVTLSVDTYGLEYVITELVSALSQQNFNGGDVILNPLNIGQFINLEQTSQNIDPNLAQEYLDTTIYELLPPITARQQRINNFFDEYSFLKGQLPEFNIQDGLVDDAFDSEVYSEDHDISAAQDTPEEGIQEEDSFITRLNDDANDNNTSKTLQSLRDDLNNYLSDVDQVFPSPEDNERPEYKNESNGYLKFRDLNQGMIIRSTTNPYIQGLNPETEDYISKGFTVTMWVRFLDKVSEGTLFNFGNPFRNEYEEPFGFKLETYVVKRDAYPTQLGFGSDVSHTWGDIFMDGGLGRGFEYETAGFEPEEGFFEDNDTERFIRLVVRGSKPVGGRIYGSHTGAHWMARRAGLPQFNNTDSYTNGEWGDQNAQFVNPFDHEFGLMTNTRVPINYGEWYFICASFNPNINEYLSHDSNSFPYTPDYWRGNVNEDGTYTHYSGRGAKCKVEIISRTDLLRARGFKVE